jgi:hypothetical protein
MVELITKQILRPYINHGRNVQAILFAQALQMDIMIAPRSQKSMVGALNPQVLITPRSPQVCE